MSEPLIDRQTMDVDIACVGFGPATAGFLTTLSRHLVNEDGSPAIESPTCPGLPLQVVCYERADDIGFGVSGVVTSARGIRASLPDLDPSRIPMAAWIGHEKLVYLLDPVAASRRSGLLKFGDGALRLLGLARDHGFEMPYVPPFLHKNGGLVMSLGQFMQFIGSELMSSGTVQIWPGSPVREALFQGTRVSGVRLCDQGVDREGVPEAGFMAGMDVHAALTVVGDGPVGAVGRQLDEQLGLPEGHHHREWAVGMKMVIDLPEGSALEPGTVFHTFGYPEPEIFGFLYAHPDRVATVGIFVPSWFQNPARTTYRYLQHYVQHPYIWRHLKGGKLRSWGANRYRNLAGAASRSWREKASRASAKAPAALTFLPVPGWTKPGPPAPSWLSPCWSCSRKASRSANGIWSVLTWRAGARAGWKRKGASPRRRATVSTAALSRASWVWRWPASPAAHTRFPASPSRSRASSNTTATSLPYPRWSASWRTAGRAACRCTTR